MSKLEADPTQGIVDIDTFALYLIGYRADVIATRPSCWHKILDHPDLPFTPPDNPRPWVSLHEVPWQDTPRSIQDIVALQYPVAAADEKKSISLWLNIPDGNLSFKLKSASLVEGFRAGSDVLDRRANIVIPTDGLALTLRDGKLTPKGNWIITQRPANKAEIRYINSKLFNLGFESFNERIEAQLYRAIAKMMEAPIEPERISTQSATLQELHDIVRILEKGKDQATWKETLVD
ncbi:hypothetical protein HYU94_00930 [Candidatus Daviesbacteria bacterium]|nr:hypothetical protein [Candidatus Daviesbacteria bacterium]